MVLLSKILNQTAKSKYLLASAALFIGFFILLFSVQSYINFQQVLSPRQQAESQYDFLVVNKRVTNSMMGDNAAAHFTTQELDVLSKAPMVDGMAKVVSNQFPVAASTTGELQFFTQLFFESLPPEYLDVQPEYWSWTKGESVVPIMLSADFLNLYNFGFALSQNLPQLSEESIQALNFELIIGEGAQREYYVANIVGFTKRYSSILIPESFMHYANNKFGHSDYTPISRVVLKTKDANDTKLANFIEEHQYITGADNLNAIKIKRIANWVFAMVGMVGIFIVIMSIIMLRLFIELRIANSSSQLTLLSILGFKPALLQKEFSLKISLSLIVIIVVCLILVEIIQYLISKKLALFHFFISEWIHWLVLAMAFVLPIFVYFYLRKRVIKLISRFYK